MAVVTVNKDGSVTVTTEDEDGGPTGAVAHSEEPVTTTFDGPAEAESKVVAASESKTVKRAAARKK